VVIVNLCFCVRGCRPKWFSHNSCHSIWY